MSMKMIKTGRPSGYSTEITGKICSLILEGKSIRHICSYVDMPHIATVMRWLNEYPEFSQRYSLAKQQYAEVIFDEILDIADQCPAERDAIAKAKLMIDARKYSVSKLAPKKYGLLQVNDELGDSNPETIQINVVRVSVDMTPENT